MKQTIETAKTGFKAIKAILDDTLHQHNRLDNDFFDRLSDTVNATYVLMNDGMCEEVSMCHSCAQNRDRLYDMMSLLDGDTLRQADIAVQRHYIDTFRENIDEVLLRIDNILSGL